MTKGWLCGPDGCGGSCGTCPPAGDASKVLCGTAHFCIEDPIVVGCSDSTREGFIPKDADGNYAFDDIASCAGTFAAQSLRASKTGQPCGNSLADCASPADLCSDGWHLCMNNGWPGDLADRITEGDCHAGTAGEGVFAAASSSAPESECAYEPLPLPCKEKQDLCCWKRIKTIACGTESLLSGYELEANCASAVWPGNTSQADASCNNASGLTGVLCCQDPPVVGH
jgi:hypothetical protein